MKNNFGISEKSFQLIIDTLSEFDAVDSAVIFGSRAKGNFTKGSDVDIAVRGGNLQATVVMDISARLNEVIPIPYSIDVIASQFLENKNLIDHIERVGVVFYTKDNAVQST